MKLQFSSQGYLRIYVTAKQEVFEFLDSTARRHLRYTFSYGEILALFAEDWEKDDEQFLQQFIDYLNEREQDDGADEFEMRKFIQPSFQLVRNPFLYLLAMTLAPLPAVYGRLAAVVADFREQLRKAREDARVLLSDCLSEETKSVSRRYWELWKDEPICLSHIRTELLPAHISGDADGWVMPVMHTDAESLYHTGSPMILHEVCYPETVQELYGFLKSVYLSRAIHFKHCRLCGKLFAAVDGDRTEYCSREIEDKKTCRDIGAARVYQKKLLGNPITRAYNRAYKTHNARIRYGTMTREEFNAWTAEAKKHRDACQAGEISLEAFEAWLKK